MIKGNSIGCGCLDGREQKQSLIGIRAEFFFAAVRYVRYVPNFCTSTVRYFGVLFEVSQPANYRLTPNRLTPNY
jgi:hypothetical protein